MTTITSTIIRVSQLQKGDCFIIRHDPGEQYYFTYGLIYECNVRPGIRHGRRYNTSTDSTKEPPTGTYLCLYCKVRGPEYVDIMVLNEHGLVKFIIGTKPNTILKVLKPC